MIGRPGTKLCPKGTAIDLFMGIRNLVDQQNCVTAWWGHMFYLVSLFFDVTVH
jgi:hypothetical protein